MASVQTFKCPKCSKIFEGFGHNETNFERHKNVCKGGSAATLKRKQGPMHKYLSKVFIKDKMPKENVLEHESVEIETSPHDLIDDTESMNSIKMWQLKKKLCKKK